MEKRNERIDKFLIYGVLLILLILLLGQMLPQSSTSVLQDNEVLYKTQIKARDLEIKQLKSQDKIVAIRYQRAKDSVKILSEKADEVRVVYREARRATETRLDSTNLYNEVISARLLIDAQESNINGLLTLVSKSDSLLDVRLRTIKVQDVQLIEWEDRFHNMIDIKDEEVKFEKKKGNRKFFKGLIGGGAIVALLVLL